MTLTNRSWEKNCFISYFNKLSSSSALPLALCERLLSGCGRCRLALWPSCRGSWCTPTRWQLCSETTGSLSAPPNRLRNSSPTGWNVSDYPAMLLCIQQRVLLHQNKNWLAWLSLLSAPQLFTKWTWEKWSSCECIFGAQWGEMRLFNISVVMLIFTWIVTFSPHKFKVSHLQHSFAARFTCHRSHCFLWFVSSLLWNPLL